MCGKERDTERKRREKWHLGKWERGDEKERKDERTTESTEMKKKEESHIGETTN